MVEEHLISPELSAKDSAAVLLSPDRTVSIMIGEEDHLRVQAVLRGCSSRKPWPARTAQTAPSSARSASPLTGTGGI